MAQIGGLGAARLKVRLDTILVAELWLRRAAEDGCSHVVR
jgi:hypothetical protein